MQSTFQITMSISIDDVSIGKLGLKLYRGAFPIGVENFCQLCQGSTFKITNYNTNHTNNSNTYQVRDVTQRSYTNSVFYTMVHNAYVLGGDIYNNDGSNAGTVYDDQPFEYHDAVSELPRDQVGLLALVPYYLDDESNSKIKRPFYDSTFSITLQPHVLPRDSIPIGFVDDDRDGVLKCINDRIQPGVNKTMPKIKVDKITMM